MDYNVEIIADSISPSGHRLTTLTATYPRFIHSELLTHRDRARNSASSRAIPFPVMIERIDENPVVPLTWLAEQKGMQGGNEIPEVLRPLARAIWLKAYEDAKRHAGKLHNIEYTALRGIINEYNQYLSIKDASALYKYSGEPNSSDIRIHKSLPNRIVEPWMWITTLISATEWKNFFRLRVHKDAEQHFQKIAAMMKQTIEEAIPVKMRPGDWHQPYIRGADREWASKNEIIDNGWRIDTLNRISAARCARVSYLTQDGKRDIEEDLKLFDRLNIGSGDDLPHASPYEHMAECGEGDERSGPFVGWLQFRKQFKYENVPG